jgi:UrcA family protein
MRRSSNAPIAQSNATYLIQRNRLRSAITTRYSPLIQAGPIRRLTIYIRHTLLAAFASIIAVSPAAAAASPSAPAAHIVRYSDLDLTKKAGRATLDRRINHAVRTVCGSASSATLQDKLSVGKCYAATRASAKAQKL